MAYKYVTLFTVAESSINQFPSIDLCTRLLGWQQWFTFKSAPRH